MFLSVVCEFILSRGVTVYYQIFHHNYPLKSRQHLTLNTISLTSLLVVFIISLFAVVIYNIYDISDIYVKMVNCVLVAIEIVIVCSILISLHVKKLKSILSSPSFYNPHREEEERRFHCNHYNFCDLSRVLYN